MKIKNKALAVIIDSLQNSEIQSGIFERQILQGSKEVNSSLRIIDLGSGQNYDVEAEFVRTKEFMNFEGASILKVKLNQQKIAFGFSIFFACVVAVCIIAVAVTSVFRKDLEIIRELSAIAGVLFSILTSIFFVIYRNAEKALDKVQSDLRKVKNLDKVWAVLDKIDSDEATSKIISLILEGDSTNG